MSVEGVGSVGSLVLPGSFLRIVVLPASCGERVWSSAIIIPAHAHAQQGVKRLVVVSIYNFETLCGILETLTFHWTKS